MGLEFAEMNNAPTLVFRRAVIADLRTIIHLLHDDDLGHGRESKNEEHYPLYEEAFRKISEDLNQYLLVAESDDEIVGTCHLTFIPSLTFQGSMRMNIEAVRVRPHRRGQGMGEQMVQHAIQMSKEKG